MLGINQFIFLVLLLASLSGCVSVKLPGQNEVKKSERVSYQFTSDQYEKLSAKWADQAWKNKKTGAVISFLSGCGSDPGLETLLNEAQQAFDQAKIKNHEETTFNSRLAMIRTVDGTIDGIPVSLDLLVFKKDGCYYTLSHSARSSEIDLSRADFEKFKNSFRVP